MRTVVLLMLLGCCGGQSMALGREWSDATGKFKIEAEFVEFKDGRVQLRKADGTVLAIPLEKLSQADQDFVKAATTPADNPFEVVSTPVAGTFAKISVRPEQEGKSGEVRRFPEQGWGVKSLAFSPQGGLLVAGKQDSALQVYDVNEESRLDYLEKLEFLDQLTACAFTPDGKKLLVGSYKGIIQLYDASNPKALKSLHQFAGHSAEIKCIAVSADGKLAVSGGSDKKLKIWTVENGNEVASFDGFEGAIKASAITKDGKLAYATDGSLLLAIDLAKNEIAARAKLSQSWASGQCAAFSPDGKWVALSDSSALRIWDLRTGKEQRPMEAGEIQWGAAFTPDGKRLISGGTGVVNVWDVEKQTKIAAMPTATGGYVRTLATSPDGLHVAAVPMNAGSTLQVFRLPVLK